MAVADIDEQENAEELTLREKVELHRAQPACAACHDRIDPPGFALENFDAIGRWREKDGDDLIDAPVSCPAWAVLAIQKSSSLRSCHISVDSSKGLPNIF